jgi:hypothetical protein
VVEWETMPATGRGAEMKAAAGKMGRKQKKDVK